MSWPAMEIGEVCFNPVLGFLSVSTAVHQSTKINVVRFNPVLGFLSVST